MDVLIGHGFIADVSCVPSIGANRPSGYQNVKAALGQIYEKVKIIRFDEEDDRYFFVGKCCEETTGGYYIKLKENQVNEWFKTIKKDKDIYLVQERLKYAGFIDGYEESEMLIVKCY